MALPTLVRALLLSSVFAFIAEASQQTEWQKALFQKVSKRAAQLSQAAIPALLARLDSTEFREELARCCPSVTGLSAEQLLQRLQEEAKVAEVVSGFPGVERSEEIHAGFPIMSIADGLRGSFFQNAWQGVLLDAKDPSGVFLRRHLEVARQQGEATVVVSEWSSAGCQGRPVRRVSYRLGQCVSDLESGTILEYTADGTSVNEAEWRPGGAAALRWHVDSGNTSNVSCPLRPPIRVLSLVADGRCRSYEVGPHGGWVLGDNAEMVSYGLKPFATLGAPASLREASERGPYAMVNQFLYDQGSPLFGDVSAVFSTKAVQDTALFSAIDTGFFHSTCTKNHSASGLEWIGHNCSAYVPFHQLGTAQHFNHLFLVNDDFWIGPSTLAKRFARLEGKWGSNPVASQDMLYYWEALPAATLQYPSDVKFLIGSFPAFFGSATGTKLQQWAKQRRWVLMWSLGPNIPLPSPFFMLLLTLNRTFALNQRLLDPDVLQNSTALRTLGLEDGALQRFKKSWAEVEALRNTSSNISSAVWVEQWQKMVGSLPHKLHMRPLAAGLCPRPVGAPECIGVNGDGRCVCYEHKTPLQSNAA